MGDGVLIEFASAVNAVAAAAELQHKMAETNTALTSKHERNLRGTMLKVRAGWRESFVARQYREWGDLLH